MSEYWKSTPKFWCRYCKLFVRDTKFEKQQHDATPRHQSNIQRSLKTIHKEKEREERDSARAKAELARLNGIVSGNSGPSTARNFSGRNAAAAPPPPPPVRSAQEDRMRQAEQLAAMGGAIPQEFRRDMAMAGQWQTVSVTPIQPAMKQDPTIKTEDELDAKAVGVRKRKADEIAEEQANLDSALSKKKVWGKSLRTFPGSKTSGADEDLDLLLGNVTAKAPVTEKPRPASDALLEAIEQRIPEVKPESQTEALIEAIEERIPDVAPDGDDQSSGVAVIKTEINPANDLIKTEDDGKDEVKSAPMPLFKKRRPKVAQQT